MLRYGQPAAARRGLGPPMTHFPILTDDLIRRLDVPGPRYTSYPTVPEWTDSFGPKDTAQALVQAGEQAPSSPLSIYVHIPFCREMCSYCGCNVVVSNDPTKADRYLEAMAREIRLVAGHLGQRRTLSRIHYGGGTPTFLDERQLLKLWRALTDELTVLGDAEAAVEIDPVVTRREQLALLRGLGFNRLSMGVQDFDPAVQEAVNRVQTVDQTRALVDYARDIGFSSVNFDLIYGLPMQTTESWRRTLEVVTGMRPDRLSVFSFAFVPDAKPHQKRLPVAQMATGPKKLDLFRVAHDTFVDAGYRWIGMDHFALPDDELAQAQTKRILWRDFQGYTIQRAADTIAFGVTGIGSVAGAYTQSVKSLLQYQTALGKDELPTERGCWLTKDDERRRNLAAFRLDNSP